MSVEPTSTNTTTSYIEEAATTGMVFQKLDARFISSSPRYTRLLGEVLPAGQEIKVGREGFTYTLNQVAFVDEIEFSGEVGGTKAPTLKVEVIPVDGSRSSTVRAQPHVEKPNVFVARVEKMIRAIRVTPDGWGPFARLKVSHVDVIGWPLDDLKSAEEEMTEHAALRDRFRAEVVKYSASFAEEKERIRSDKDALSARSVAQETRLKAEEEASTTKLATEKAAQIAAVEALKSE